MNHLRTLARAFRACLRVLHLAWLRCRYWNLEKDALASFGGWRLRITDGPNFYMQCKDEFIRRIYHFDTERPDPKIIDGGGNMGMSILYFKRIYPKARIISFEPDPQIHALLTDNLQRNGIHDVQVINAGLAASSGMASFSPDSKAGGRIEPDATGQSIRVERLSDYLAEPVDFMKLNIEGMELPVLQEAATAGKLKKVRQLVLEYHGWPNGKQCLGEILTLLDQQGFRYLIHDFDAETCGMTKPPFRLSPRTTWFCLVYAKQVAPAS